MIFNLFSNSELLCAQDGEIKGGGCYILPTN
jgi:hypothetical protein